MILIVICYNDFVSITIFENDKIPTSPYTLITELLSQATVKCFEVIVQYNYDYRWNDSSL